jgi:hypothetical protein
VLVLVLVGDVGSANRDLRLHELSQVVRSFFKASSHLVLLWIINFDVTRPCQLWCPNTTEVGIDWLGSPDPVL